MLRTPLTRDQKLVLWIGLPTLIATIVGVVLMLPKVQAWLQPDKPTPTMANVAIQPNVTTPGQAATIEKRPEAKEHKRASSIRQVSKGSNSPNLGNLTQGDCSVTQLGGKDNQASVNCSPPPKRQLLPSQCDTITQAIQGKEIAVRVGYILSVQDSYDLAEGLKECFKLSFPMDKDDPSGMGFSGTSFSGVELEFHGPALPQGTWAAVPLDNIPLEILFGALHQAHLDVKAYSSPTEPEGSITVVVGEPTT
jgi:hypothetical protein